MDKLPSFDFLEIGSNLYPAAAIQERIDLGHRGIFVDANQQALIDLSKKLKTGNHSYLCCLVGPKTEIKDFFINIDCVEPSAHSSVFLNHVTSHLHALENIVKITMASITIQDIVSVFKLENISILNLDCEGFDGVILQGCSFEKFRPRKIIFEYTHSEGSFSGRGSNYNATITHLNRFGYRVVAIRQYDVELALE